MSLFDQSLALEFFGRSRDDEHFFSKISLLLVSFYRSLFIGLFCRSLSEKSLALESFL